MTNTIENTIKTGLTKKEVYSYLSAFEDGLNYMGVGQ